jgi:hypothetical protein
LRDAAARPEPDTEVKTYYMVPNRRVQGFVGREDVLSRVKAGFQSGPGPRIVVIRAMGIAAAPRTRCLKESSGLMQLQRTHSRKALRPSRKVSKSLEKFSEREAELNL